MVNYKYWRRKQRATNSNLWDITKLLFPYGLKAGVLPDSNVNFQVQTPASIISNFGRKLLFNSNLNNLCCRGRNIIIGTLEVIGGIGTWIGTITAATTFTAGTEGLGVAVAGAAVEEGIVSGAILVGDGLARIAGAYDTPVLEDVVNASTPIEKDIADNISNISNHKNKD